MKRNCHLRLRRHTWCWTGNGYQSFWGGWRNEKKCQECGHKLYVPGVRRSLPLDLQGDIQVGGIPKVFTPTDFERSAPPGQASECPYCGWAARTLQEEIAHMESAHPDIIARRLGEIG